VGGLGQQRLHVWCKDPCGLLLRGLTDALVDSLHVAGVSGCPDDLQAPVHPSHGHHCGRGQVHADHHLPDLPGGWVGVCAQEAVSSSLTRPGLCQSAGLLTGREGGTDMFRKPFHSIAPATCHVQFIICYAMVQACQTNLMYTYALNVGEWHRRPTQHDCQ
jgi:hypothetical protein